MPALPASPIFHSSSSSKSPNSSRETISPIELSLASVPSTMFQPLGTASVLKPRQASSDLPSNSTRHWDPFVFLFCVSAVVAAISKRAASSARMIPPGIVRVRIGEAPGERKEYRLARACFLKKCNRLHILSRTNKGRLVDSMTARTRLVAFVTLAGLSLGILLSTTITIGQAPAQG